MREFLRHGLLPLSLFVAAGLSLGAVFGHVAAFGFLALLLFSLLQLRQLYRLRQWLAKRAPVAPSGVGGLWSGVYAAIAEWLHEDGGEERGAVRDLALPEETGGGRGLVLTREDGDIVWFNRAAAALLGLKSDQDRGANVFHLIRNPDFLRCYSEGRFGHTVEMTTSASSFSGVCVLPYARRHRLILVDDLSRLQKLETMNRDLIANVSHELRSPLTVVLGYLDVLDEACERGVDRRLDAALVNMRGQGVRMQRIVSDLLELSELDVMAREPGDADADVVDIGELATTLAREVRELDPDGRCRVVARVARGFGVRGDRARLHSAFSNLVGNAVRYSPDGGAITLSWERDAEGGARFCVADEGVGIEARHLPRLTERFYRADKDRSRTTGGTGLGLAIVKHVLNRHDAKLEIESAPGRGSTFCCRFPAARVAEIGDAVSRNAR